MESWSKKPVEWIEDDTAYMSVVFTWDLPQAYSRCAWLNTEGHDVIVGGPAVRLMPEYLSDVATIGYTDGSALRRHHPCATRTSTGCVRKCPFCAVPIIEGGLVELNNWEIKPIVCDNNLLACSRKHFDRVIDSLKPVGGVDFNQGLDARFLTQHHAERLVELDPPRIRLAWDFTANESQVFHALELLGAAGFPHGGVRVYVLIGYQDTPEDALYRLQTLWNQGYFPFPMRYQPLDTLQKNQYVGLGWTESELQRYMRYWSNLRFVSPIPFEEWRG